MKKLPFELYVSPETYTKWIDSELLDRDVQIVIENARKRIFFDGYEVLQKDDPRFIEQKNIAKDINWNFLMRMVYLNILEEGIDYVQPETNLFS